MAKGVMLCKQNLVFELYIFGQKNHVSKYKTLLKIALTQIVLKMIIYDFFKI